MTLDWGTIRTAQLKGGDFCLYLRCPAPFLQLIETCLTGWQIVEATNPPRLDIIVTKSDAVLKISGRTQTIINHSPDPIDALNYLCLDLAYCCAAQSSNAALLHCAAFGTKGATQIAFGKKGVGKSTLSFHHAYRGDRIFADDLLLWDRSKNRFICLGLPLRMRRPLPKLDTDPGQRFIAGKSIAYSRRDAFDIAPAGFAFFPDEIVELTPTPEPVPLTQVLARIKAFSISKSLTNFHSETLEG